METLSAFTLPLDSEKMSKKSKDDMVKEGGIQLGNFNTYFLSICEKAKLAGRLAKDKRRAESQEKEASISEKKARKDLGEAKEEL